MRRPYPKAWSIVGAKPAPCAGRSRAGTPGSAQVRKGRAEANVASLLGRPVFQVVKDLVGIARYASPGLPHQGAQFLDKHRGLIAPEWLMAGTARRE